jgi:hypothetical protein
MKNGLFVLAVVCTKLLEMKEEMVYIHLSALFILIISEQVLVQPDSWQLSSEFVW